MRFLTKQFKPFILCYHQISEERMRSHVSLMKSLFTVEPMLEMLDNIFHLGKIEKGCMAFSMDDCYVKDFDNAKKVCLSENVNCTFFIPLSYARNRTVLWPQRLMTLFKTIGEHFENENGATIRFQRPADKTRVLQQYFFSFNQNEMQTGDIEQLVSELFIRNGLLEPMVNPIISLDEVCKTQNELICFESHSMTHPKLFLCTTEEVIYEMQASDQLLATSTGSPGRCFCYPYGSIKHIGDSWKQTRRHYQYGVTLIRGTITKKTNPLLLPRIDVYEHDSAPRLLAKIILAQQISN